MFNNLISNLEILNGHSNWRVHERVPLITSLHHKPSHSTDSTISIAPLLHSKFIDILSACGSSPACVQSKGEKYLLEQQDLLSRVIARGCQTICFEECRNY